MDLETVTNIILDVEADLDLLERTISDVHYWERVRFSVHREIRKELGLIGRPHSSPETPRRKTLLRAFRSLFVDSPFLVSPSDLLVYGHSRRKQMDDGTWWDIYCDPVVETLDTRCACLEDPHEGSHLTPERTDDLRHLDFVRTAPLIIERLTPDDWPLSRGDIEEIERIADRLEADSGVRPSVVDNVRRALRNRRIRVPLYRRIINRVDPELAMTVVSYGREPFVEACKQRGVPVVELQHGVVSPHHMGYAYPGNRTKRTFPDYFLSFGTFWDEIVEFPLPSDRIIPVGYPYLERRRSNMDPSSSSSAERIVFLSQGTIGNPLSKFAAEFADRNPGRDVIYKLHPGEYSRWRREYPWLAEAELRIVDESGPELYDLFAESSVQVGVYSTALYEGLAFDLETYVVDLQGAAYMQRLVEMGGATLVRDVEDLEAALAKPAPDYDLDFEQFFKPDATRNVRKALESIREREDSESRAVAG